MTVEIIGIGGCALCAVVLIAAIKRGNQEYALLAACAVCAVILLSVFAELGPVVAELRSMAEPDGPGRESLTAVFKAVGIAIIVQLCAGVCRDAGESAMGSAVELAGRAAILTVALPLLAQLFGYLEEIARL